MMWEIFESALPEVGNRILMGRVPFLVCLIYGKTGEFWRNLPPLAWVYGKKNTSLKFVFWKNNFSSFSFYNLKMLFKIICWWYVQFI